VGRPLCGEVHPYHYGHNHGWLRVSELDA
jgi:hypothetical protein